MSDEGTVVDGDRPEIAATEVAPTERADASHPPGPTTVRKDTIGRFRILGGLGSGGMADVYRAYDPVLDRAVALKVLHTKRVPGDTQGMRRVLREARAAAALTHPNTVTIYEVGEADGDVFIAMELLEGVVLRRMVERGASLSDKLRWLHQAATALAAAHDRGLVHRDVKPDNMFVCSDGSLKLLDFGIAKREDDEVIEPGAEPVGPSSMRTEEGRRVGTPRYMAPEQHAGQPTDARTDLYAWGLVAFELLTGSHPVVGQATVTMDTEMDAATTAIARSGTLRLRVPELPEPIAAAIVRALELRKEDRFPSMAPVIALLATRDTKDERGPPRKRVASWKVAACVVAAVGLGGAVIYRLRPSLERETASAEPRAALTPLCRVVATRSIPLAAEDRVTVMNDGSLVFARKFRESLVLEQETPQGTKRFAARLPTVMPEKFHDLTLRGVTLRDKPVVFLHVDVDPVRGATLQSWLENGEGSMSRLWGHPAEVVPLAFGKEVIVIATMTHDDPNPAVVAARVGTGHTNAIEEGEVSHAAAAASGERLAVAYRHGRETHFALLDRDVQRIGDVKVLATYLVSPAVAFVGPSPVVFWTDVSGAKTRLTYSTFTPGEAALSAPKVALDDPLVNRGPLTARLPDGTFAVAWLVSKGGPVTLRVSPIGPTGELTGPSDIGIDPSFDGLQATSTTQGIDFTWRQREGAMKLTRIACGAVPH